MYCFIKTSNINAIRHDLIGRCALCIGIRIIRGNLHSQYLQQQLLIYNTRLKYSNIL